MRKRPKLSLTLTLVATLFISLCLAIAVTSQGTATVSGVVVGTNGPVGGATVRIQATANSTTTAADGTFTLQGLAEGAPVTISAWKHLYYCVKVEGVVPPATGITLLLERYQTDDNPDYEWMLPISDDPEVETCASCKLGVTEIWLENAHAGAGTNRRFLSLYNATDLQGDPGVSPGYVEDFPGTTGNCADCHAPGAAMDTPFTRDMNVLEGADTFGVHCDFCHKVADVYLNPATGLPYANMPGVTSMDVRRPWPETERYQLFFGTFDDDNVPEEDTRLPLLEQSQFCAPCHQFSFWGTPIYESFQEWSESPYPDYGVECQTCHMPSDGIMTNVAPGHGGLERDPATIHAHTQPGAADVELLQNTVVMSVAAEQTLGIIRVSVSITNTEAGHHVPTDFPGRHMILTVTATDEFGQALSRRDGPTVPEWGGAQAELPGKAFAKVLRDVASGDFPVVSYWKQALIVSDNRIAAFDTDTSVYSFAVPRAAGTVIVMAQLLFRRAFQDVLDVKGWDSPDIMMEGESLSLVTSEVYSIELPLLLK